MEFLIFGKNGLIGSSIYKKLNNDKNLINTYGRKNCDYIIDLCRFDLKVNKDHNANVLIHSAGITDEEINLDKEQAIHKNTQELVKLVDWARRVGVEHFIYVSSAHVYGDLNRRINENSSLYPKTLYANLHLFAENYIRSVFNKYSIIRPNAIYGNIPTNFKRWNLIPFSFPNDLAKNNKIVINSHGKQFRNFVSTNTIANIINYISINSIYGEINPIGFHTMSVKDFAKFCIETLKKEYKEDFFVKVLSEVNYVNKFHYHSEFEQFNESPDELKNHIIKIYKQLRNNG